MFKIIAGDVPKNAAFRSFLGATYLETVFPENTTIHLSTNIERVEIMNEQKAKSFLGAAVTGAVGGLILGPLGAIAGILAGGNKNEICFACYLKNGKKFMAVADSKTYQKIAALAF